MNTRFWARLLVVSSAVTLGVASGVPMEGQREAEQNVQAPTFRTGVEAVQLSVIVTDAKGNPVSGLAAGDFEIIENNIARPVTTFGAIDIPIERVDRSLGEPDVLSNERPPGRVYLIVLDQMEPEKALRSRHFLREFVQRFFGLNDTAAVVLTTRGLRASGHDFTSNPRLLLDAIDKFNGGDQMGKWEREKNISQDLLSLMRVVASVPGGRKALIFVSEALCGNPEGCQLDPYRLMGYRGERSLGFVQFDDVNPDFLNAMSFATRNNIAFYPFSPAGLTTEFGGLEVHQELKGLAELTGGFALTNSNNYAAAFERLVRENSTYYLLGFDSAEDRQPGRYVNLEVRVNRPGLQVRSIDGYLTPRGKPEERRAPTTVLAAAWDAVASPMATSGVPIRMYAAPFRSNEKKTTVAVTLEIQATKLNLVEQDGAYRGAVDILFAVSDSLQRKQPIQRHRATLALKPETYDRVSRSALRVHSELPLPEGRYQVRASVGGAVLAGSVVYDVAVPNFRDDFVMSGVALMSDGASQTLTVSPHAKLDLDFPNPPTTAREFSRDDVVTLFAELYENRKKSHTVTFTIELRDGSGKALGGYTTERHADKPKSASVYTFSPRLTLDTVPPGRYALHIDARSSLDGRKSQTRDIPITVR